MLLKSGIRKFWFPQQPQVAIILVLEISRIKRIFAFCSPLLSAQQRTCLCASKWIYFSFAVSVALFTPWKSFLYQRFWTVFFNTCYRTQNLLKHITLNLFPLSSSHCNKCNSLHFLHHVFPPYITRNEYHHNKIHSLWHSWLIPAFHQEERLLQPLWIYTDLAFSIRRHAVMQAASREGKPFPACWWNKDKPRARGHICLFLHSWTSGHWYFHQIKIFKMPWSQQRRKGRAV